jgi:Cu/Ag efflux protein CusF
MMRSLRLSLAFLALGLALGLAACGEPAPTKGTGKGTVVGTDAAKREITLDHGAIGELMGAMTMTFTVADPKLLDGFAPGAKVEFDVEQKGDDYVVTAIRPR